MLYKYANPEDTRIVRNQTLQDQAPERYWDFTNDECWANLNFSFRNCENVNHIRHRNGEVEPSHSYYRLLEHETRHVCLLREEMNLCTNM